MIEQSSTMGDLSCPLNARCQEELSPKSLWITDKTVQLYQVEAYVYNYWLEGLSSFMSTTPRIAQNLSIRYKNWSWKHSGGQLTSSENGVLCRTRRDFPRMTSNGLHTTQWKTPANQNCTLSIFQKYNFYLVKNLSDLTWQLVRLNVSEDSKCL